MGTRRLVATVPTAFHADGVLDHDGQAALAGAYAAAAVTVLVALETSGGEPGTLDPDERDAVVRAIRAGAGGAPVFVGVGTVDPDGLQRALRAAAAGASGLVAGIEQLDSRGLDLLGELAGLGLPLWLHQPSSARVLSGAPDLFASAIEVGVDTVIVEATPTPDRIADAVQVGLTALGGLAGLFLPEELEAGAAGTIAASAVPERVAEILAEAPGESGGAIALDAYLAVVPYLRLEAGSPGLLVRKEAWRQRGVLQSARTRHGRPLARATKQAITRRLQDIGMSPSDPYPGA